MFTFSTLPHAYLCGILPVKLNRRKTTTLNCDFPPTMWTGTSCFWLSKWLTPSSISVMVVAMVRITVSLWEEHKLMPSYRLISGTPLMFKVYTHAYAHMQFTAERALVHHVVSHHFYIPIPSSGYRRAAWGDTFTQGQIGSGYYSVRWYECGVVIPDDLAIAGQQPQTTQGKWHVHTCEHGHFLCRHIHNTPPLSIFCQRLACI